MSLHRHPLLLLLLLLAVAVAALLPSGAAAESVHLARHHPHRRAPAANAAAAAAVRVHKERSLAAVAELAKTANWMAGARAAPTQEMTLYIAVKQRNREQLQRTLLSVSDPASPQYGKHLSMLEVNAMVAPHPDSVAAVRAWLAAEGAQVAATSSHSDFITVHTTVAVAERLLAARYRWYRAGAQHSAARRAQPLLRLDSHYSLPASVAGHVDFVSPTVHFPRPRAAGQSAQAEPEPEPEDSQDAQADEEEQEQPLATVTPNLLRTLYQMGNTTGQSKNNSMAVASFLEQYWSRSDLKLFAKNYYPLISQTVSQVGPNDESEPGIEAQLDIQYISAMGAGIPTWVYYTAGRAPNPENEPFVDWLVNVSSSTFAPLVFSVSYGEDEQSVGVEYGARVNVELQKLGVRGTSVLAASGDSGAGGSCVGTRFSPDFPSGSPWITAVGGLQGGKPGAVPTGETVASLSGGGFSDFWPRPSYQDEAVAAYLKQTGIPPVASFNVSGRGYPDVSAQCVNFVIVDGGYPEAGVSGTSASCPTVAGVVAMLNDLRLSAGKPPLGFLNPLIYAHAASVANAFNDATVGTNEGCGSQSGFPAKAGWDPASGWGSPNFAVLSKLVVSLP